MIILLIFFLFFQTKPSFCHLFAGPSWTFLPKNQLTESRAGGGEGDGDEGDYSDTTSRRTWQNVNNKRSAKNSKCTRKEKTFEKGSSHF